MGLCLIPPPLPTEVIAALHRVTLFAVSLRRGTFRPAPASPLPTAGRPQLVIPAFGSLRAPSTPTPPPNLPWDEAPQPGAPILPPPLLPLRALFAAAQAGGRVSETHAGGNAAAGAAASVPTDMRVTPKMAASPPAGKRREPTEAWRYAVLPPRRHAQTKATAGTKMPERTGLANAMLAAGDGGAAADARSVDASSTSVYCSTKGQGARRTMCLPSALSRVCEGKDATAEPGGEIKMCNAPLSRGDKGHTPMVPCTAITDPSTLLVTLTPPITSRATTAAAAAGILVPDETAALSVIRAVAARRDPTTLADAYARRGVASVMASLEVS